MFLLSHSFPFPTRTIRGWMTASPSPGVKLFFFFFLVLRRTFKEATPLDLLFGVGIGSDGVKAILLEFFFPPV